MKIIDITQLDEKQVDAINRCLDTTKRCVGVTGPAGSGKTTIIRFAYEKLVDAGYSVRVAAPTGKAAKRIREATDLPASTIHLLLEFTSPSEEDPKTGKPYGDTFPRRTKENPLDYDVIIVDEYAMVHRDLHADLVNAMKHGSRLLVFGDNQQLPPIETNERNKALPTAFNMILDKFDGIHLKTVHRTQDGSHVFMNAKRILDGLMPQNKDTFRLIPANDIITALLENVQDADFTKLNNQIITPGNISWVGVHKLNAALQTFFWSDKDRRMFRPMRWKNKTTGKGDDPIEVGIGEKVIITRNMYDVIGNDGTTGAFNGESGIISDINFESEEITINFGERQVVIPSMMQNVMENKVFVNYPQRDIALAYAVTTHKAQGSEFENVIYVIGRSLYRMLNRRNLYTAVTRARQSVKIIYDKDSLSRSVMQKEPMG